MISASQGWKKAQEQLLLPESFLEISVCVNDMTANREAVVNAVNEAEISNSNRITSNMGIPPSANYATLEHNLWTLDGSKVIMPDFDPYGSPGYVGVEGTLPTIEVVLPNVRTITIPGFTIVWSSEHGDYPTDFTIQAKNGDTVVASTTVTGNDSNKSLVAMESSNYDSLVVTVSKWSLPDRRARVDSIVFGHVLTFGKNEILGYSHEQTGDLLSGELPKNSIEFTLDNTDGRWNPSNPEGLERYLSERQEVVVRYGLTVNGGTEWIDAGTFYISEWRAPSNGFEARFTARDSFEFLLNTPYVESGFETTMISAAEVFGNSDLGGEVQANLSAGDAVVVYEETQTCVRLAQGWVSREFVDEANYPTYGDMVMKALAQVDLPTSFSVEVDPSMYEAKAILGVEGSVAEIIQMCANACCCTLWQDRDGVLNIKHMDARESVYTITQRFSYSHPEVELIKPLKGVQVNMCFGEQYYRPYGINGEVITVTNSMISDPDSVAEWVESVSKYRKTVSGEYRADPRLDLFDMISVESKYGLIENIMLTDIKYTYGGAFKATYVAREVY